jgi:hypothetical protein
VTEVMRLPQIECLHVGRGAVRNLPGAAADRVPDRGDDVLLDVSPEQGSVLWVLARVHVDLSLAGERVGSARKIEVAESAPRQTLEGRAQCGERGCQAPVTMVLDC